MIPALKEAIALQSGDKEWSRVRAPLIPISKDQSDALRDELKAASFVMDELFDTQ